MMPDPETVTLRLRACPCDVMMRVLIEAYQNGHGPRSSQWRSWERPEKPIWLQGEPCRPEWIDDAIADILEKYFDIHAVDLTEAEAAKHLRNGRADEADRETHRRKDPK